jgi:hypothetical protein
MKNARTYTFLYNVLLPVVEKEEHKRYAVNFFFEKEAYSWQIRANLFKEYVINLYNSDRTNIINAFANAGRLEAWFKRSFEKFEKKT